MIRPIIWLVRHVRGWLCESSYKTYVSLLLVAAFPVFLTHNAIFGSGYPNGGELFSNLIPALHGRYSLSHGQLPVYTEHFYTGRYQFLNPLWYGFYPPAWILFLPFVPLDLASELLIAVHIAVVPVIAYYYAKKELRLWITVAFSLIWVLPIAAQVKAGHLEKIFSWPWFVLLAWQLTPDRLDAPRHRPAYIAGFSIGMMLLAGGNYYAAFSALMIGCLVLSTGSWEFLKRAIVGGTIGIPHLLSVVPPLLTSISRPSGRTMSPIGSIQLVSGLFDVWIFDTGLPVTPGYAVVGLGTVVLGLVGCYNAFKLDRRWCIGLLGASLAGMAFITGVVYVFPPADALRTGTRANMVVAVTMLLFARYALQHWENGSPSTQLPTFALSAGIGLLLVTSVVHGSAGWVLFGHASVSPDVGERTATALEREGCESAWIEPGSRRERLEKLPYDLQIAFKLTEHRIATRSLHYGAIGQTWTVRDGTNYTFDSLILGERIDGGSQPLYGDWYNSKVGEIDASDFTLLTRVSTNEGPVFIYTNDCQR